MEELIARIENALRYRLEGKMLRTIPDAIKLGNYLFHPNRQTLTIGSTERKLSFRENELLKMLYENRQQVIDRKEILNLLWGNDSFFNSRNLDVYVTKLRSYLREDDTVELITIKGIGYRFVLP